jgi:hypothetical protein
MVGSFVLTMQEAVSNTGADKLPVVINDRNDCCSVIDIEK